VAAGAFLENRPVEEEGWVEVPDSYHSRQGMFVAQVVGRSMEPRIPDGSYAVFRPTPAGSREGRILLVELEGEVDPELGTGYTLKRWHSEKSANRSDDEWEHTSIRLEPLNPEFEPLELQPGPNRRVIAEFVGLLIPTTSDVAGEPTHR
jgi:SOS-response transcriptional repressor LexA